MSPGTAYTSRSNSHAHPAVLSAPERNRACVTINVEDMAAIMRLRSRKRRASGIVPGHSSLISAPPCASIRSNSVRLRIGPIWLSPPANTATVLPTLAGILPCSAFNAPQCAAASVPIAPPDTTRCPATAACSATVCATYRPYSVTSREPTMPTGLAQLINARGSPLIHKHSGGAQSERMDRSANCEGQHGWPGPIIHCVPSIVNQSASWMMSCEGRSIMRLCQPASALRKERIAFADALRPHRVRPSTNMRSIRDSAGPQISDGWLGWDCANACQRDSAFSAPLSVAYIITSAPSRQNVSAARYNVSVGGTGIVRETARLVSV